MAGPMAWNRCDFCCFCSTNWPIDGCTNRTAWLAKMRQRKNASQPHTHARSLARQTGHTFSVQTPNGISIIHFRFVVVVVAFFLFAFFVQHSNGISFRGCLWDHYKDEAKTTTIWPVTGGAGLLFLKHSIFSVWAFSMSIFFVILDRWCSARSRVCVCITVRVVIEMHFILE